MKSRFEYLRPQTAAEAVEMKSAYGESARFWAGGTDLFLEWRRGAVSLSHCIDLTFVPGLDDLERENGHIRMGALVTLSTLERADSLDSAVAPLASMARLMCTVQTRTLATVGGNLCNASPAADLAPLLLVLDADAIVLGPEGVRTISMDAFFVGVNRTSMREDELLVELRIPTRDERGVGFGRVGRSSLDIALALAAASISASDGVVSEARIALGSLAPTPRRSRTAEDALVGTPIDGLQGAILKHVSELAGADASPISDVRTTAAYRKHVSGVLSLRALEAASRSLRGETA